MGLEVLRFGNRPTGFHILRLSGPSREILGFLRRNQDLWCTNTSVLLIGKFSKRILSIDPEGCNSFSYRISPEIFIGSLKLKTGLETRWMNGVMYVYPFENPKFRLFPSPEWWKSIWRVARHVANVRHLRSPPVLLSDKFFGYPASRHHPHNRNLIP